MNSPTPQTPVVIYTPRPTANWIIAIALSVIAVVLLLRPDVPFASPAFAQNTLVGSRGLHAFTGQLDKDTWGLFMMDVDAGNVWVYEYLPRPRRLKLVAARSFTWDRYLQDFNGEEPSPEEIKELVARERNARTRAAALGAGAPPPTASAGTGSTPPNADDPGVDSDGEEQEGGGADAP